MQITKRKDQVLGSKHNEEKDNFEVQPAACVGNHSHKRSTDNGQAESYEDANKETSYEGELHKLLILQFEYIWQVIFFLSKDTDLADKSKGA